MSDNASMITFATNLADQEEPVPLPQGNYAGEITAASQKVSAASGNPYISLSVMIPADQYPADYADGDPDGTILSYNRFMLTDTQTSRWRLKKFLESVGIVPGKTLDLTDLLGRGVTVTVGTNEFEGEKRAEIKKIAGVG